MLSRQSEPADARPTPAWPADQVERWPIEQLTPYANNARLHSEACARRSYQERARTHVLAQRRIRFIVRFCTRGKEKPKSKKSNASGAAQYICGSIWRAMSINRSLVIRSATEPARTCRNNASCDDAFDKVPF
jgi:hypothetical protein